MVKGHILISFLPGFEASSLPQVRATPGILGINLVFGHWDAVAVAEARNVYELSKLVTDQIRGIQGVQETETLVHIEA